VTKSPIVLCNGSQTATFQQSEDGFRPDWFRVGNRPMLRFKDHEWLNIGGRRVTDGALCEESPTACVFGGRVEWGGAQVDWTVRVALPADGQSGFVVTTTLIPLGESIELLEALSTFELPYEYDGQEHAMTVICQQPVYRLEDGKEISGAGYNHPIWYYARPGKVHLTYPSSSPMLASRVRNADGSNQRCTMFLGNWNACSIKDIFAHPTREESKRRGWKFLVGALNWNCSLIKDPNVLVQPGVGLSQELIVDFTEQPRGGRWDTWLASGWERLCRLHFPTDGDVSAYKVATEHGASWVGAAEWLAEQFGKPEGCPGFFNPAKGTHIYAPGTRPVWDDGTAAFAGQWTGPLAYLGHVWGSEEILRASARLEDLWSRDNVARQEAEAVWTIGHTPMYVGVMRKAQVVGVTPPSAQKVEQYVRRRAEVVLNPPPGAKRGDGGILAWDAFANLIAADLFERAHHESVAKELLARVNRKLDEDFWTFNCAAEGDFVGAGQSRPFGHAIAASANVLAWRRFGDARYLEAAERFGNLLLGMHFITYNESQSLDLDTRGWAHGSTGGRDQWCQIPPWETGHSLQQFGQLIAAGKGREGFYDVLWLHSHTGLAQFPKARSLKRLHNPDMSVTYRPSESLPTEREFYLRLPYLAYENPWDQTLLAGYQGVEPIIHSLFFGGGLVRAEDHRVLALAPEAACFAKEVATRFTVELWNPTAEPIETRLIPTVAAKQRREFSCSPATESITVPPRQVTKVIFTRRTA